MHTPAFIISREALQNQATLPKDEHTLQHPEKKYLCPLVCPLMKVTENTTHICLLRAFLFWLENESVEEIENKKCKSSLPLCPDKTGAHTPLPGRDPLSAFIFSSFHHTWHHAGFILAQAWHRPAVTLLSKAILRALMQQIDFPESQHYM